MTEEDKMVPLREFGRNLIAEMIEELFGRKMKLDPSEFNGVVASITLENIRQYDGWDIRISIGPPGAFNNRDDDDN
jgi:hypothetical protein